MSALASNAKKRGDNAEALRWSAEAFDKSEGPATRLQWGASYVGALVELAPTDEARDRGARRRSCWREAAAQPDAFYERSARSLQRVGTRLQAWNQGGAHAAAMTRLQKQARRRLRRAERRSDADRATCSGLLDAAAKPSA